MHYIKSKQQAISLVNVVSWLIHTLSILHGGLFADIQHDSLSARSNLFEYLSFMSYNSTILFSLRLHGDAQCTRLLIHVYFIFFGSCDAYVS